MQTYLLIKFLLTMNTILICAAWNDQKCYICDTNCDQPTSGNIKSCTQNSVDGTSGKPFVTGALGLTGNVSGDVYGQVFNDFEQIENTVNATQGSVGNWTDLTRWVCYVTKDKHRGCLIMAKGLCNKDTSLVGRFSDATNLIRDLFSKAAEATKDLFTNPGSNLNDEQKRNVSRWFVDKYMFKLINASANDAFKLDSCCEGDNCNFGSIIEKSTAMIISFLSLIYLLL